MRETIRCNRCPNNRICFGLAKIRPNNPLLGRQKASRGSFSSDHRSPRRRSTSTNPQNGQILLPRPFLTKPNSGIWAPFCPFSSIRKFPNALFVILQLFGNFRLYDTSYYKCSEFSESTNAYFFKSSGFPEDLILIVCIDRDSPKGLFFLFPLIGNSRKGKFLIFIFPGFPEYVKTVILFLPEFSEELYLYII